jgi:hypothetical protein
MNRGLSSRPAGFAGVSTQLAVVLVLAAAVVLLLPSVASAKVKAVDRAHYRSTVHLLVDNWNSAHETYNAYIDDLYRTINTIIDIESSDPVDHDALLEQEAHAASMVPFADEYSPEYVEIRKAADYFEAIAGRSGKASWFTTGADRIHFKGAIDRIKTAMTSGVTAYDKVSSGFAALQTDPPDVGTANEDYSAANASATLVNEHVTKGFDGLVHLLKEK